MKRILLLITCAAVMVACQTKKPSYKVTGIISGADDSVQFVLQKRVSGQIVTLDSAMLLKGKFEMKGGAVEFPEMVTLLARDLRKGVSFYLENAEITISGHIDSLSKAVITGSKTQDEYKSLQESLGKLNSEYSELYAKYRKASEDGNKEEAAGLEKQMDEVENRMTEVQKDFIKNNPSSFVAPSVLRSISYYLEADEIESYINAMDTTVRKIQMVKDLETRVEAMKKVAVGQKAPDFTLNSPDDKPISLWSKVGQSKLLLVDFWASWCGPCRQENPNVVRVWTEFNKKGFDVFGVSLDRPDAKDKWVQAIKDDKLTWTHVSDLKYWDCEAAKLYAVNAIPANFLLDENGVIIARNLRGDNLYNKVKEILGSTK